MKKLFILLCCSLISISAWTNSCATKASKAADKKVPIDHIVAVVNDDVITEMELEHTLTMIKLQMAQAPAGQSQPDPKDLEKQILDQMINKKLQLQLAKQANLSVSDEEVDGVVERIAKQNNIPTTELYDHIKDEGLSKADYRAELQSQLLLQKLQQQEVVSRINISQSGLKRFTKTRAWEKDLPVEKEYDIEDTLVPVPDNATAGDLAKAKKQASTLVAELQKHPLLKHADQDGVSVTDLGYKSLSQLPSAFATKVITLRVQQVAGPIQTGNGFHIIRLSGERPVGNKNPEEPTPKQIEELLFQHKVNEALQVWLSKLRSQAFILTNTEL